MWNIPYPIEISYILTVRTQDVAQFLCQLYVGTTAFIFNSSCLSALLPDSRARRLTPQVGKGPFKIGLRTARVDTTVRLELITHPQKLCMVLLGIQ